MINLFSFGDTNVKQVQNCDLQINPFVFYWLQSLSSSFKIQLF